MNVHFIDSTLDTAAAAVAATVSSLISPELAALLAGMALLVALIGSHYLMGVSPLQRRLNRYVVASARADAAAGIDERSGSLAIMDVLERRLARRRAISSIRTQLGRAGASLTVSEFLALRVVSALLVGALVGIALAFRIGTPALAGALLAGLLGSYLPRLVVSAMGRRRMTALEKQIPDALDLIASALQAGSGLGQGLALVAREMAPPMSEEIRHVLREVGLGLTMTDALTNLANRVDNEDLDLVVTAIIIQMRVGGNLAQVLRTASNTIRERMVLRGEISVLTAQQRFSALVITLLPIGVAAILWLLNSEYMGGLLEPGLPQLLLVAAIMMQLAGMFVLKKIAQIDV